MEFNIENMNSSICLTGEFLVLFLFMNSHDSSFTNIGICQNYLEIEIIKIGWESGSRSRTNWGNPQLTQSKPAQNEKI